MATTNLSVRIDPEAVQAADGGTVLSSHDKVRRGIDAMIDGAEDA